MYRTRKHCGPRPDHGMPPDSAALRRILALMRAAREAGPSVPHGGGPPIIHDSAGLHLLAGSTSQCVTMLLLAEG